MSEQTLVDNPQTELSVEQECAEAAKSLFEFINFQTAKYGNRITFTVNIAFVPATNKIERQEQNGES